MPRNDNYLDVTADIFSDMHVIIEGAIAIYENGTGPLIPLCTQHKEYDARSALNDVGGALYNLRRYIQQLQSALQRENERLQATRREENDHD